MAKSVRVGPTEIDRDQKPTTGCIQYASLFQDPLIEEPPRAGAAASQRRRYATLANQAAQICSDCPLRRSCLYTAVAEHDVAGIVAGTTQRERAAIRRDLNITVEPENFDVLAGASPMNRPVDHQEVVRMHRANPGESLDRIADRLGCSLSTVKRHLRQERQWADGADEQQQPGGQQRPTTAQVMAAADRVVTSGRASRRGSGHGRPSGVPYQGAA